jgi:hypothetical protein
MELLPQPVASRDIRVIYLGHHPKVYAYNSSISEFIHPGLAVAKLAYMAQDNYLNLIGGDETEERKFNKLARNLEQAEMRWPIWKPARKQNILRIPWEQ